MIKRITLCRYVPQGVWFCHNTEPFFRTLAQPFFRAVVLFFFCTHKNAYTYRWTACHKNESKEVQAIFLSSSCIMITKQSPYWSSRARNHIDLAHRTKIIKVVAYLSVHMCSPRVKSRFHFQSHLSMHRSPINVMALFRVPTFNRISIQPNQLQFASEISMHHLPASVREQLII